MCVLCVGCPFAGGRVGVACQRHGRGAAWPSGRAAIRTWPLLDRVCARACMCVRACVRASLLRTHPCPPPPLSFEGMMFCDLMSTVYCDTCSMAWVRWRIGSTLAPTPSPCPNRSSPLPSGLSEDWSHTLACKADGSGSLVIFGLVIGRGRPRRPKRTRRTTREMGG